MSDLTKEAAYIKGLFDGMKLDSDKDVTKILSSIIGFIEKAASEIELLDQEQGFLADQIDDIEEVVEVIAEEISDDFDDFDEYDTYQIKCENCGCDVPFTDDELDEIVDEGIECPSCGEIIKLDLGDMEDECGCGCGCDHEHEHE